MLHRIRKGYGAHGIPNAWGTVEMDECYVGGKNKNRHKDKKVKYGKGRFFQDKTTVLGMYLREKRKVMAVVIQSSHTKWIQKAINENVFSGSTLITDEAAAYRRLAANYNHITIDHSKGQYADGDVTTNRVEHFWCHLKRGIINVYRRPTQKHMQLYVNEYVYRYNHRDECPFEAFRHFEGHMSYKSLIAA